MAKSVKKQSPNIITLDGIECHSRGGKPYMNADNGSVYTGKSRASFVVWIMGKDISRVRHGKTMLYSKEDIDRASIISGVSA
jgi:hypothetical protein